ncbi:MAG TPA: hypothetical protein VLK59_03405 [Solirubrobacteraceae bacterium]|nr:hypothetical protein [Solirubrobacteraceae bacterium]
MQLVQRAVAGGSVAVGPRPRLLVRVPDGRPSGRGRLPLAGELWRV